MAESKFYEESAGSQNSGKQAKMYTVMNVIGIVFFVIVAILLFISIMFVPTVITGEGGTGSKVFTLVTWFVFVATFAVLGWFTMRFKRRYNVSYDYVFVEDELRVTKVFNGRKRKFLYMLKTDRMLKIGYCESESYEDTVAGMKGKKPKILTPNSEPSEGKEFIYILCSDTMGKELYVLECRKMMLEYIVRAAGVNKFARK